ncbi:transcription initiation factor TFIID subunit 8 [Agrilus planipennis]|uniref:Transcription initiation factor TFIID subunit 8 n=1 Tax=Agrilus planipennis TaxID=224129 RepID=A0A1W4XLI9_AGRPL|nr:transcription initiation factor TFIID subunit 8 [Agrilus planipennis]
MEQNENVYRKMLAATVSNILLETGFDICDKESLGSLTEMLQCFLCEIGSVSKNYCELSSRSEPLIADVILGFVEMGFDFSGLDKFAKSFKHGTLPSLQPQQPQKQLSMLHAGTKQQLPNYIPHHLPPFPDPHAYIRTPTHKQPVIDYEAIREKAAIQKKDIERALTKFLAKTNPTHNLFDNDESNIFPLIACKPAFPPYLSALLLSDQVFDAEDLEYDPKTQDQNQPPKKKQKSDSSVSDENKTNEKATENITIKTEEKEAPNWEIDNPYLAATKMPIKNEI